MKLATASLIASLLATPAGTAVRPEPVLRPMTLQEAITMALANNESIVIQRETLIASEAATLRAEGVYDPYLELQGDYRHTTQPVNSPFLGAPEDEGGPTLKRSEALFSLTQYLPTGGIVAFHMDAARETSNSDFVLLTPAYYTRVGVEFRQPLLRGRATDPSRTGLLVAAADRARSAASLRREVTQTVAAVEDGYWRLASARQAVQVREEAVNLADEQLGQTRARVEEGAAPETEISQPLAELERRRGELYAARETLWREENSLKRLILDSSDTATWASRILTTDDPNTAQMDSGPDLRTAAERALSDRPEIQMFEAQIERRRAETALARDTLKPGLEAFVSYDRLGLAGDLVDIDPNPDPNDPSASFSVPPDWLDGRLGRSYTNLGEGRFDDARAGVVLSLPIGNRAARGEAGIAEAAERQSEAAMDGVRRTILSEVLDAGAAVQTAVQRVEAARAAREAAGVQLSSEEDRYSVGLSTNFLVLTRQNDLSRARLDEIDALADYRKARTEMARATGSLLSERRIEVADQPMEPSGK